jgi:hypothetical protein
MTTFAIRLTFAVTSDVLRNLHIHAASEACNAVARGLRS